MTEIKTEVKVKMIETITDTVIVIVRDSDFDIVREQ